MSTSVSRPSDDDVTIAKTIFDLWQSGAGQAQAVATLRPLADASTPWAVSLMCWLTMQQGHPGIEAGMPFARQAVALGMPWSAVHFLNNALGQISSLPNLKDDVMALFSDVAPFWTGADPVGQGWNLLAQGDVATGLRLMGLQTAVPLSGAHWDSVAQDMRDKVATLDTYRIEGAHVMNQLDQTMRETLEAVERERADLATAAKQAGLLVSSVVSDATASLFKADADKNEKESKSAWVSGLAVLVIAALVAVAPLVLHYSQLGPKYSSLALLGAHAGSTAALATVAGVLLARARSRDLARQRANDLSTAMGTMIAYSNQIQDPAEKQRFTMSMGQLVLQAHLTVGSAGHSNEESAAGLLALANLVRPPAPAPQPNSTA